MNNWLRQIPSGFGILPSLADSHYQRLSCVKMRQMGMTALNAYMQQLLASLGQTGGWGWIDGLDKAAEVILCHHLGRPRIVKP